MQAPDQEEEQMSPVSIAASALSSNDADMPPDSVDRDSQVDVDGVDAEMTPADDQPNGQAE